MSERSNSTLALPATSSRDVLTDILRDGAQRLLSQAVEAEVADWIASHAHVADQAGHRQVVRNGHLPKRTITTGVGPIEVQQPRVLDRRAADKAEREVVASLRIPLPCCLAIPIYCENLITPNSEPEI